MIQDENSIWCIAYINRDFIDRVAEELQEYEYDMVEAYIPTVKILKKKFKNKQEFEEVPLLFNYGFFKVPYEYACNEEWLAMLRQRITAIYGWVKDGSRVIREKPKLIDNSSIEGYGDQHKIITHIKALPRAAVATDAEVTEMVKAARLSNIFSQDDIDNLKPGQFIVLKGYPFDDLPAEVVKVNKKSKQIIVKLLLETAMSEVKVSFENVFYTIYNSFDSNMKEVTESEMNIGLTIDMERALYKEENYE